MVELFGGVKLESLLEFEMWSGAGDVGSTSPVPKESRDVLIHDYDVE